MKPGDLVRSETGSTRDRLFLVTEREAQRLVLWDGSRYRVGKFKRKNPAHCRRVCEATAETLALLKEAEGVGGVESRAREADAHLRKLLKREGEIYGKRRRN